MSEQRRQRLDDLRRISDCEVVLITPANLSSYILPHAPLHPAYPYLSAVHKSDYLRCYLMHFYGGGYSDIKAPFRSWKKAFRDLEINPTALANVNIVPTLYQREGVAIYMIQVSGFIFRPQTEFTHKWYAEVNRLLDMKLEALRAHPASHPYSHTDIEPEYPVGWTEICSLVIEPLHIEFFTRIMTSLPGQEVHNHR